MLIHKPDKAKTEGTVKVSMLSMTVPSYKRDGGTGDGCRVSAGFTMASESDLALNHVQYLAPRQLMSLQLQVKLLEASD